MYPSLAPTLLQAQYKFLAKAFESITVYTMVEVEPGMLRGL